MKVYKSITEFKKLSNAVVTSGTFDGVHLGHSKILINLISTAKANRGESVVITFWPHPRTVLKPEVPTRLLSTLEEKIQLLDNLDPDHLLILPFNKQFSELSSKEFIQNILIDTIGTKTLIIGYDHRFGKNREGSFEYLKAHSNSLGFNVEEIPKEDINNVTISSTSIRNALQAGDVKLASKFLGRPYFATGIVAEGAKLGRTIGFPTANIEIADPNKLLPADGVYAVSVVYKEKLLKGMMNIGFRPTVAGSERKLEVHLFDFKDNLYGEHLTVKFIEFLRPERKFASLNELKEQLVKDQIAATDVLKTL